jgi:hypothetical protein
MAIIAMCFPAENRFVFKFYVSLVVGLPREQLR